MHSLLVEFFYTFLETSVAILQEFTIANIVHYKKICWYIKKMYSFNYWTETKTLGVTFCTDFLDDFS